MKYSDWRYELQLHEKAPISGGKKGGGLKFPGIGGLGTAKAALQFGTQALKTASNIGGSVASGAQKVGKIISGREKTASQKRIIKTGGIKAARDVDGDGKLEMKRRGGEYQETLLYDVVHDYIIAENFASDTEGANKVMLKLSDELMQEIYERMMTASEKRKDTMLKKKYDDSDMKKNMQAQYGKEEGKKVYFATIRKQAMEGFVDEAIKSEKGMTKDQKMDRRNVREFGKNYKKHSSGYTPLLPNMDREADHYFKRGVKTKGVKKDDNWMVRQHRIKSSHPDSANYKEEVIPEEVGITTHSMMMKDKAKKEAMLRMKEREAVAKKLRKEERDEYGDPVGGPKISKKEKEKNLKKNTPDEQHTTTTSEGYGSERVGPALTMARVIDKVNPRPKPTSKRTRVSRALKMASIKKDEKIRKRQENPYSADKKLKMVATSIRDRVRRKVKSMAANEDYIPEEGYDIARDMGRVRPSKDKKDGTTMPPSAEMKKTQKVNKGPSALELVKKKYGKAIMDVKKK